MFFFLQYHKDKPSSSKRFWIPPLYPNLLNIITADLSSMSFLMSLSGHPSSLSRSLINRPRYCFKMLLVQGMLKFRHGVTYQFSLTLICLFKTQIEELLNHLIIHNAEKVNDSAPLKYLELIQFLRVAHNEDLEVLWNKYKTMPSYR